MFAILLINFFLNADAVYSDENSVCPKDLSTFLYHTKDHLA